VNRIKTLSTSCEQLIIIQKSDSQLNSNIFLFYQIGVVFIGLFGASVDRYCL